MEATDELEKEQSVNMKKFCSINLRLLPLKFHFFFFAAGIASFSPYLPLHAKQSGLSATAIGMLYFTVPVTAVILKPMFGWLADKYKKEKLIVITMLIIAIIFYLVIGVITPIEKLHFTVKFQCINYDSEIVGNNSICFLPSSMYCKPLCSQRVCNDSKEMCEFAKTEFNDKTNTNSSSGLNYNLTDCSGIVCPVNDSSQCEVVCSCNEWCHSSANSEYSTRTFWMFLICFIFVGISERVVRGLTDAICFEMLQGKDKNYGKQKIWHTLGGGAAPFLAGYLLDATRKGESTDYNVAIYLSIACMLADIIVTYQLDLSKNKRKKRSTGICRETFLLFSQLRHFVYLLIITVGGMMYGYDLVYYNIFMQEIGATKLLIGISLAAGLTLQIPFLFYVGNFIEALGHFNSFALSLICTSIKFISFSYIYNPLWALLPQILLICTLDFMLVGRSSYAKRWAPPGTESTIQQVSGSIFGGLGVGLGYSLGGLGFDYFGSRQTYVIASIISGITATVTILFHRYMLYYETKPNISGRR